MNVSGKNVLVTGAARGIGRGVAMQMAANGANVLVNTRNEATLAKVLEDVKAVAKGKVTSFLADVGYKVQVEAMFDHMVAEFGGVDVVVNNAAIGYGRPFLLADEEWWNEVIRVNLSSVFFTCRRAVKEMIKRGSKGSIINLSSIGATKSHRQIVAYDASKGGVDAFTKALAVEMGPWDIRVNAISPAVIVGNPALMLDPEIVAKKDPNDFHTPILRQGTPEDIANLVQFLASDASSFITGQSISVDGGLGIQARPHQLSPLEITPRNLFDKGVDLDS